MADCPTCGVPLAGGSRFCPQCGSSTDAGDTNVLPLPPDETGQVPIHHLRAEPRLYGVTPATLVLVLAGVALTLAIVLFVLGHWAVALAVLAVALLLLAVFVEAVRRRPAGPVARASAEVMDQFRARAEVAADSLATRGWAVKRVVALRRELQRMAVFRAQLLSELGDAVYRGDGQATETARGRVEELDKLAAAREAEMQDVVETAQRRIEHRRLEIQPTEIVELIGEGQPPEPAVIPEQYPPPDEGNPPQPAVIPEPSPAVIPEPSPAVIPEPGPEPMNPEARS